MTPAQKLWLWVVTIVAGISLVLNVWLAYRGVRLTRYLTDERPVAAGQPTHFRWWLTQAHKDIESLLHPAPGPGTEHHQPPPPPPPWCPPDC
jgi:hypothetical protein